MRAVSYKDMRVAALLAAIVIYALWGAPTPDRVGGAEILIGVLLLLSIGASGIQAIFMGPRPYIWQKAGKSLLLYGMSVPLMGAVLAGNDIAFIVRDVIPFLFLLLPLLLFDLFSSDSLRVIFYRKALVGALVFLGLAFAMRVVGPVYTQALSTNIDPRYLANAPTVLFAALILMGMVGRLLYSSVTITALGKALALCSGAFIPALAMMLIMQRAHIGMVALALVFWLVCAFVKAPRRAITPALFLFLILLAAFPVFQDVFQMVSQKTVQVGLNMRGQEALAVLDAVSSSGGNVLFGKGWGASFSSPAVAGVEVNFTHNLLTTYGLKTGLCGIVLVVFYLGALGAQLLTVVFRRPILAVALGGPFLIDVFLYASFKSLDFGLLLLLISIPLIPAGRLHPEPDSRN